MSKQYEYSGLCMNCLHAPNCMHRLNHKNPIMFCEDFFYEKREEDLNSNSNLNITSSCYEEESQYSGLCMNCSNRKDCSSKVVRSGVVNCNEYDLER